MKILVADYHHNLKWVDTIYQGGNFRSTDGRICYNCIDIYAVKDDNRNKTVICSACGKEVPNNASSIKAHKNMINKSNKCFGCSNLSVRNDTLLSQKYVLNEDGTYSESTKRTVNLSCRLSYRYPDINSEAAREVCKYRHCQDATFRPIEDFWTKYPNAFDELITVDRIVDTGYKRMYKNSDDISFVLNGKAYMMAKVNSQGVCYQIDLHHRSDVYKLRYSKKYDKVWVVRTNGFKELDSLDMAKSTKESIIKRLKTLYK